MSFLGRDSRVRANTYCYSANLLTIIYILQECLLGFLASKTVVYVTHHVEFLPSADVIMVC